MLHQIMAELTFLYWCENCTVPTKRGEKYRRQSLNFLDQLRNSRSTAIKQMKKLEMC